MRRSIEQKLLQWKQKADRKPLILKGVRQAGKTYILQAFGEKYYPRTHYVNFEKAKGFAEEFKLDLDPKRLIQALGFYLKTDIDVHQDLVIFDEIQACPDALTSLKYFCEDLPELDLCSAGSLLGVYLGPVSFPVGKVDILVMHPMSFEEFLEATGDIRSIDYLQELTLDSNISEGVHSHLWERLKYYFVIGGLPEVVATFIEHEASLFTAFSEVRAKQDALSLMYNADMAKHSGKINAMHIDRVWKAVPNQLAAAHDGTASKFKFRGIIPGVDRYSQLIGPIDWLEAAGLVTKVQISNSGQLPFSAYTKENAFKLYMFDVGMLGAVSGLSPKTILDYDYGTYKGYFAENFVAQELINKGARDLYSWHENRSELEFIVESEGEVLPIEVKSGWVTKTKSLNNFAEKYQVPYRTILSANNLYIDKRHSLHRYPLYLTSRFPLEEG